MVKILFISDYDAYNLVDKSKMNVLRDTLLVSIKDFIDKFNGLDNKLKLFQKKYYIHRLYSI